MGYFIYLAGTAHQYQKVKSV